MDADLYKHIISHLQHMGHKVLTEHVGSDHLCLSEQGRDRDAAIYEQDTTWLRESDVVIAECTCPSLGVGYELAYAEALGKPCYLFYNPKVSQLSAMLTGDPYFHVIPYTDEKTLFDKLEGLLAALERSEGQ